MKYTFAHTDPQNEPKKKTMGSTKSENFKATYLRLLSGTQPTAADYWAVPELINEGLATGNVQFDHTRSPRTVSTIVGFAPTVKGRLMADDLADQAKRRTWRYRLLQALFGASTFALGWLSGVGSQVAANLVTKQLGG